jgi:ABC-type transport system involved in multi-copper enzyme maturation permease subunit
LFAIVVGVWQNKAEKNQGTFLFLLHRPVRREAMVGMKLLAGVSLCLMVFVLPLVCFTYWAETKSLARSDGKSYLWSVSSPICLGIVLLYLGAFMSSVREAAWYKSQFLPLFAAIAIAILLGILANSWTPFVLIAMPIVQASYVVAILYEAVTRNYS